jgi:predicted CopG family antitoxin
MHSGKYVKPKFDTSRYKTMVVTIEVYNQLCELGKTNDSFSDVISRLLEQNKGRLVELISENRSKANVSR